MWPVASLLTSVLHKITILVLEIVLSVGILFATTETVEASNSIEAGASDRSAECAYAVSNLNITLQYFRILCDRHGYQSDICAGMRRLLDEAWREFCKRCTKAEEPLANECYRTNPVR